MLRIALATSAVVLTCSGAFAQETGTSKTSAGETYMHTSSGSPLYVFDNDRSAGGTPGPSTCYDQCVKLWPPFMADASAKPHGDWTVQDRKDGTKQWAYKGRPLYTFVRDTTPTKIEGNGFNGNKWHVAEP